MRILILEPYCGGSHQSFLAGLTRLPVQFEAMTLPARNWKWRMRLSAPYFAYNMHLLSGDFDRIICSGFVDVATLRGLAPPWVREIPILTYFHENQFVYPRQVDDERDIHFALTNLTTALASDSLAFNSRYNLTSFLEGVEKTLRHSSDLTIDNARGTIEAKSRVLHPGIDYSLIDAADPPPPNDVPLILWNHRWEHDKNPDLFFQALYELDRTGPDFALVILGQSFLSRPAVFDRARRLLSHRILHCGYVTSREDYARWLSRGDICVSTARHEFFGMATMEAVRAGCRPLLPHRLVYPELFDKKFLYQDQELTAQLRNLVLSGKRLSVDEARKLTEHYSWDELGPSYLSWIEDARLQNI